MDGLDYLKLISAWLKLIIIFWIGTINKIFEIVKISEIFINKN